MIRRIRASPTDRYNLAALSSYSRIRLVRQPFSPVPATSYPTHYDIRLAPDLDALRFDGSVGIDIDVATSTDTIVLNVADIDIKSAALLSLIRPYRGHRDGL